VASKVQQQQRQRKEGLLKVPKAKVTSNPLVDDGGCPVVCTHTHMLIWWIVQLSILRI